MAKISVVIPVYNTENYLKRCVESVLNQTFGDFEVILVNDGSTDKSADICDNLKIKDSRISVIHKANGGLSSARNTGIAAAKADYIYFVDSDDYLEPNALEVLLSNAASDVDVVACGYYLDYLTHRKENFAGAGKYNLYSIGDVFAELKAKHIFDPAWNKLIKLSIIKQNSLEFPKGELYEDTAFNLNLLKLNPHITVISDCLYNYVQRSGSITKRFNPQKLTTLKKRGLQLIDMSKQFNSKKAYAYCNYYYIKYLFSCFIDFNIPSSGFTPAKTKQTIKSEINSADFASVLKNAKGESFLEKLVILVAKTKNVFIINLFCKILYKLR